MSDENNRADEKCPIIIVFCPIIIVYSLRFTFNFVTENIKTMNKTERKTHTEGQWHKSTEAQQFSEDREQLLETIREMMDNEFERHGIALPDSNPTDNMGTGPPKDRPEAATGYKASRRTLWQRIVSLFSFCAALTSLDLKNFNTENVTNMYSMFYKCNALTSLNLSSFNTAKVTTMETMLYECTALTTIYCDDDWARSGINSNVMFSGCT